MEKIEFKKINKGSLISFDSYFYEVPKTWIKYCIWDKYYLIIQNMHEMIGRTIDALIIILILCLYNIHILIYAILIVGIFMAYILFCIPKIKSLPKDFDDIRSISFEDLKKCNKYINNKMKQNTLERKENFDEIWCCFTIDYCSIYVVLKDVIVEFKKNEKDYDIVIENEKQESQMQLISKAIQPTILFSKEDYETYKRLMKNELVIVLGDE